MKRSETDRKVGQHHGDLRAALLKATLNLIEMGERSPSLRAVAREAGVSSGAPYHHFKDHHTLLAAVADEGFQNLADAQTAALKHRDPWKNFESLFATYVQFSLDHQAHYLTMFDVDHAAASVEASARQTFANLVGAVIAARPDLTEKKALRIARDLWAYGHGLVVLAIDGLLSPLGGTEDPKRLAKQSAKTAVAMLSAFDP